MAVTRHRGATFITLRGPETAATSADCPAEGEWLGIRFRLGTFMPQFPPSRLRDRNDVTLTEATAHSFWLTGSAWEYPTFENAETFVNKLVTKGLARGADALGRFIPRRAAARRSAAVPPITARRRAVSATLRA